MNTKRKVAYTLTLFFILILSYVSLSADKEKVDLYEIDQDQTYVYISDKDFFGEDMFDETFILGDKAVRFSEGVIRDHDPTPRTYPYPLSNKKCSAEIPVLLRKSVWFTLTKKGICKVYCNKQDQCYAEIEPYITEAQKEEIERINKEKKEKYNIDLDWGDNSILPK